jgi:hypothetical protein
MINQVGPFTVETVGDNPYLCGYRTWLTSKPEKVYEFPNARSLGNFFDRVCADHLAEKEEQKFLDTTG